MNARRRNGGASSLGLMPPGLVLLGAAVSGWATSLAFPDRGWWPLAYAGMACLLLALRRASPVRAAGIGLVWGLAFFLPLVHWALQATGSVLPWVALSLFQALYVAGFGALWAYARRAAWLTGRPLAQSVTAAVLWVAIEQVRGSWSFGGFPWGFLAFSQTEAPLLRLAPYGGEVLVSAFVAATGALMALGLQHLRNHAVTPATGALVAAGLLAGAPNLLPVSAGPESGSLLIGAVQGNVPQQGADWADQARDVTANHAEGTERLAVSAGRRQLDLVVWPESAADIDPRTDRAQASTVDRAAAAAGAPLLLGTQRFPNGQDVRYNEVIVWTAGSGVGDTYAKQHPVPFGEYVPFRSFFRQLTPLVDRVATDMAAGGGPAVLDVRIDALGRDVRLATGICFEVAYGDLIREGVLDGAELIVIPTNNASFGRTPESTQQLAMSRFRAVEHARSTVQVSTVGVSAMIMADGTVVARTGLFTDQELIASLPLRTTLTPAARLGATPQTAAYLLAAAAVVSGALAGGRRPGRDRSRRRFPRRLRAADDHAPTLRLRALPVPVRVWDTRVQPLWSEWRLIVGLLVLMAVAAYTGIRLGQDIVEETTTTESTTSDAAVP
ncbi:apolipoprotein N-acyltransferase [Actinotalea ferrariae]|uniref:apolipoprotein N-acyltransferase n=1 Tax=Actinotalea ferrariae TaxID=1386098 RepID=UPI001C8C7AC3|nr:apolipoprotein N-acyltransferase [Actinotalea ferrariae]